MESLLNPVFLIAILILIAVFVLVGAAILGKDSGVLARMSDPTFARGLITYLFTVITIGTAVVLVVYSLTSTVAAEDKQFDRGKDVLSLLLGVFGTMVGFYFGSELKDKSRQSDQQLQLTSPLFGSSEVASGETTTIAAHVRGGTPPYRFGTAFGKSSRVDFSEEVRADGWIQSEVRVPKVGGETTETMKLAVRDAAGETAMTSRELKIVMHK
jgi:hypothetical protein